MVRLSQSFVMASLSPWTWVRLAVWLALGFCVYFFYSIKHSKLQPRAVEMENFSDNSDSREAQLEVQYDDDSLDEAYIDPSTDPVRRSSNS